MEPISRYAVLMPVVILCVSSTVFPLHKSGSGDYFVVKVYSSANGRSVEVGGTSQVMRLYTKRVNRAMWTHPLRAGEA